MIAAILFHKITLNSDHGPVAASSVASASRGAAGVTPAARPSEGTQPGGSGGPGWLGTAAVLRPQRLDPAGGDPARAQHSGLAARARHSRPGIPVA